jgi:hypothetical protein
LFVLTVGRPPKPSGKAPSAQRPVFFTQKKSPASGTFLFYLQPVEQQNRAVPSRCAVKVKAKKIEAVVQSTHDLILMAGFILTK